VDTTYEPGHHTPGAPADLHSGERTVVPCSPVDFGRKFDEPTEDRSAESHLEPGLVNCLALLGTEQTRPSIDVLVQRRQRSGDDCPPFHRGEPFPLPLSVHGAGNCRFDVLSSPERSEPDHLVWPGRAVNRSAPAGLPLPTDDDPCLTGSSHRQVNHLRNLAGVRETTIKFASIAITRNRPSFRHPRNGRGRH
jgi:hypothetical protein